MATAGTLHTLFGSEGSAGVLAFLTRSREGYASEIARYMDANLYAVQRQLSKFESAGLLSSRKAKHGRARIYAFDPKHPLVGEIKSLVGKATSLEDRAAGSASPTELPEELRTYFWDVQFRDLSWQADGAFILRRVLTDGSWEAVTWLRKTLGDSALRRWLVTHRGRGLSPRQLRFWALILGLPKHQIDAWIRAVQASPWQRR
ncbi:MAG: DUF6922 domain-containing protein [Anaerolineales bacterium]